MKKEYLILIAIIVFASSYLFLHKENQDNYKLPEIKTIDAAKITGIIIQKSKETINFTKKNDKWLLSDSDKEFPANSSFVKDMFDAVKTFKLTALVSRKSDLQKYELDQKKRINVQLSENNKTVFEFTIGKPAPSFNHTFVMIANDKNIYHANGSLKSDFDKTLDEFKEKIPETDQKEEADKKESKNLNK
jgi:hypothetical protein